MSDKELIIQSLERVERRIRLNRVLGELTFGIAIFLPVPVLFKLLDLFHPFRGLTVAIVLGLWLVALVAYLVWRTSGRTPLSQAAAMLDREAALRDEIKSAYWFITNGTTSEKSADWVALQVRRAAQHASQVDIERLHPRIIPRASYLAAGLVGVLIALNFVPVQTNHNWMLLQGAPAF